MESWSGECERISVAGIDDAAEIGRRIRETRETLGMKQADLARRIGANNHTVWRYETQGMTPSAPRLRKIAEALGVSERFLMTGADVSAESTAEYDETVRTALSELLADWDPELHGAPPDSEEVRWLGTELDFRQDQRAGLEITPRLLLDRLKERRRQQRGKAIARPQLTPPPPRPGRRKLSETSKGGKRR